MTGEALLVTERLEKRFGGVCAIAGVDFTLAKGELRCLIGPNGAGKSTFFKMLTAQLRPSAGRIVFDGRDITRRAPHEISRLGIGIKNQVPDVYDGLTVIENIWLSARFGKRAAAARRAAHQVIERLSLEALARRRVGELSHGQRQWVEFGMVIALEPKLILLDEPTAGMSLEEIERTASLIRAANESASIIVVEHDMLFIRQIATTVTVFHQGQILAEGTMAEIQAHPEVRAVYLGRSGIA